jgi:chorismate mutase/prephenate dehydratase
MQIQLDQIRNNIDAIDNQLLSLLNQRIDLIKQVGELKRQQNAIIYRPEREKAIIERLSELNRGGLTPEAIETIFLEIFAVSRNFELPERVGYLGPEGTFSHQAAESRFGAMSTYVALGSIQSVFESVATNRVRFGVVPIENNQEGTVMETIDLLAATDVKIAAEIPMNIHFTFASEEDRLDKIKVIYSKDIAFKQCSKFLRDYFGDRKVDLVPVESTSKAAQLAKANSGAAALCSHIAAKLHGLPLLFQNVEDSAFNRTRFLILSKEFENQACGNDKTTLIAKITDKAGSLATLLDEFRNAGINLTKIESRPIKNSADFKYWFLIELDGHSTTPNVKTILEKHAEILKFMGSYVKLC